MTAHLLSRRSLTSTRQASVAPWLFALVMAVGLAAAGCEDKAIGRPCDVQGSDAGANTATANPQALECPSRICLKQVKDPTVAKVVDTVPFCTAECSKDADCEDGQRRDKGNNNDKRCQGGWVCGIPLEVSPNFCCKKFCMCKDFLNIPSGGLPTPASCQPGTPSTCANKSQ